MNAKEFSTALGEIDDAYLAEAIAYTAPKRSRTRWIKWVAAAACLCILIATAFKPRQEAMALTVDEVIAQTFESIGVTDAVYVKTYFPYADVSIEHIRYHSATTGLNYEFDNSIGRLTIIEDYDDPVPETDTQDLPEPEATLTIEQGQALVLEFVKKCLDRHLIGELTFDFVHDSNVDYLYTLNERYQGQETGTSVLITCSYDGRITFAMFDYGSIYCRNGDGEIVLASDTPFIAEQTAIDTAMELTKAKAKERGNRVLTDSVTVELKANSDQHYYEVSIDTLCEHDYIMTYYVQVDVYSGEILTYHFTQ